MKEKDNYYMKIALENAKIASKKNEVPIGCVIVYQDKVIASTYNRKTIDNVSVYHAEVLAIIEACRYLNSWYLDDCYLYTTVEPCLMCTGAILQSRIKRVIYGTKNDSFGYLTKCNDLKIEVIGEILENECREVLSSFFRERRNKNSDGV